MSASRALVLAPLLLAACAHAPTPTEPASPPTLAEAQSDLDGLLADLRRTAAALDALEADVQARRAQTKPAALSPSQRDTVFRAVRQSLKDPESARFGALTALRTPDGAVVVCGRVNARNTFGGYAGEAMFYGALTDGPRFSLLALDVPGISYAAQRDCQRLVAAANERRADPIAYPHSMRYA